MSSSKSAITGKQLVDWIVDNVIKKPWDYDCAALTEKILSTTSPDQVRSWMPKQGEIKEAVKFSVCAPLQPGVIVWIDVMRVQPIYKFRQYLDESTTLHDLVINKHDIDAAIDYIASLATSGKLVDPFTAFTLMKLYAMTGFAARLYYERTGVSLVKFTPSRYYENVRKVAEYYSNVFEPYGYKVLYLEYPVQDYTQHAVLVPIFLFGPNNPLVEELLVFENTAYGQSTIGVRITNTGFKRLYALIPMDPIMVISDTLKGAVEAMMPMDINIGIRESITLDYRLSKTPEYDSDCATDLLEQLGFGTQEVDRPFVDTVTCIKWRDEPLDLRLTINSMSNPPSYKMANIFWSYPVVVSNEGTYTTYTNFDAILIYDEPSVKMSGLSYALPIYLTPLINYLYNSVQHRNLYTSLDPCATLNLQSEACRNAVIDEIRALFAVRPVEPHIKRQNILMNYIYGSYLDYIETANYLLFMSIMGILVDNDYRLASLTFLLRALVPPVVSFYGTENKILGAVVLSIVPVYASAVTMLTPMFAVDVATVSGTVNASKIVPNMSGRFLFEVDDEAYGGTRFRVNSYTEWLKSIRITNPIESEGGRILSTLYDWLQALSAQPPTMLTPKDPNGTEPSLDIYADMSKAIDVLAMGNIDSLFQSWGASLVEYLYNQIGRPDSLNDVDAYNMTKRYIQPFVSETLNRLSSYMAGL